MIQKTLSKSILNIFIYQRIFQEYSDQIITIKLTKIIAFLNKVVIKTKTALGVNQKSIILKVLKIY